MKRLIVLSVLALGLSCPAETPAEKSLAALGETSGAVFSPDGKSLAFERQVGWDRHLGVCDLASGEISWIENGPGAAGMASWGADGSLVYTFGAPTNTAFEAYVKGLDDGYGIRIWKDGVTRDFLKGRRRDATPSFSPDMKTVYWTSSEGNSEHRLGQDFLWAAPVGDAAARKRIFFNQMKHIDAAASQPQVSPDGRLLVWANLDCIQDRWSIRCAHLENPDRNLPLTAPDLIAYEPRWSADGKYLVYTGYRDGDASWSCYIQEVSTGTERRLCTGTEPCLSPDGKWLVYTDPAARRIRFRAMKSADYPFGSQGYQYSVMAGGPAVRDEQVVFTATEECDLPPETAFPDVDETVFVRAEVEWSGDQAKVFQRVLWAKYGPKSHDGINFIFYMQAPTLAICDAYDSDLLDRNMPEQTKMQIEAPAGVPKGTYVLTGIRSKDMVYLSVNGAEPTGRIPRWAPADLSHPDRLVFAENLGGAAKVKKVEFGRGWPRNVPKPLLRRDLWPRTPAPHRSAAEVKSATFEKVALIDAFDYAQIFDIETEAGARRIVDYAVDEVGATSLYWRHQGGGVPRYASDEERSVRRVPPFEKRIQFGGDKIYGWVNEAKADLIPVALAAIAARGAKSGFHMTWEENHMQSASCSQWNLEHPEFSCRMSDGQVRPGYTSSLGYDEVLAHKLGRLDELLAMKPDTVYIDLWRQGGWYASIEFTPKMRQEWKSLYGDESADASDERWLKLVSKYVHRYLRAIRKRLDATGRKIDLVLAIPYVDLKDRGVWTRYAVDWKELAADGTLDAVSVMSVVPEKGREFESTAEIYRYVIAHKGRAKKVYFPLAAYDFAYGIPSYVRATGLPRIDCVKRLLELARDCGGAGVTLECVDFDNYRDDERKLIREFN